MKLVFYGPYGQRREVVEKVNLDSKLLQKGKVVYEVSGVKSGRSILETDEQKIANALTRGDRYYTNVRYGVGDKTSLAVGATSYERSFDNNISNPEQNTFLHSSLTTTFQSILLNMDLAHQTNTGGSAVLLSFNTPVFSGSDLFASSQIFTNDFVSEIRSQATGDTAWRSNNIFRFTTGVNVLGRYISNIYTVNFTTLVNGNITYVQSLRNAVTLFPFLNISNVLNLNQNLDSKIATGVTNVTLRHGSKLLIRGSLGYRPFLGTQAITVGAVNMNYNIGVYGLMMGALKDFERGMKSYNMGVNYSNSLFLTSINVAYSKETKAQLMLSFASGIVFSGLKPQITPFNASTTGSVEVDAFLDENQNGIKDFDEKAVAGVGVTITGREMNKVTDNEGTMILTNLPMGSEMLFDVNTGIMPDITMKGGKMAKRRMVLLSGATHVIMLPIIQTTEIDGTLAVKQGDTQIPMGNVQIKLIDKENRVVQTTKTSSDGYYIFSEVPHGVYKVKLDDKEVKRYKDYLVEYHD